VTEILIHNNEVILYHTEWLEMPVILDDLYLTINRAIVTGEEPTPPDFINPYRYPEQLAEERQRMRPKQWQEFSKV